MMIIIIIIIIIIIRGVGSYVLADKSCDMNLLYTISDFVRTTSRHHHNSAPDANDTDGSGDNHTTDCLPKWRPI